MGELLGVKEALNSLVAGDTGGDEDRGDNKQARELLAAVGAKQERDAKRYGGEGVADVVDHVRQQGNAPGGEEDDGLDGRGQAEDAEADGDGADAVSGSQNRPVDEAVRVAMPLAVAMIVVMVVAVLVVMVRLVIMVRVHVVIAVGAAVFVVVSVRVVVVDPCRMRVLMAVDEGAVVVFVGVHVGVVGMGVVKCRHWLQGIDLARGSVSERIS